MTPSDSGPNVFASPYVSKSDVVGRVVAVLRGATDRRGLVLENHRSRAATVGQIHELMSTDETIVAGAPVDRVALIAFVEVVVGGIVLIDDRISIGDTELGSVAGFNDTHMPNHQNICLCDASFRDGEALRVGLGEVVRIYRDR